MNPWMILGWMLVALVALGALWVFVRFFVIALVLAAQMARAHKDESRAELADQGKVQCEQGKCSEVATHKIPGGGYYCQNHVRANRGGTGVIMSLRHTRAAAQSWRSDLQPPYPNQEDK